MVIFYIPGHIANCNKKIPRNRLEKLKILVRWCVRIKYSKISIIIRLVYCGYEEKFDNLMKHLSDIKNVLKSKVNHTVNALKLNSARKEK